MFTYALMYS